MQPLSLTYKYMAYKITITRVEEKKAIRSEYQRLFDVSDKENQEHMYRNGERIKNYGYVDHEVTEEVKTIVLEQTVDKVDMVKVIKAINSIED